MRMALSRQVQDDGGVAPSSSVHSLKRSDEAREFLVMN